MNTLGPITTSGTTASGTTITTGSISAAGLGKNYDMIVYVGWSDAGADIPTSVTWNGENLTYLATSDGVNGHIDGWFSDGSAQTSGTVVVTFSDVISNGHAVAMLFGDLRRAGGGWLDDWLDLRTGTGTQASLTSDVAFSGYKGTQATWAFLWETTTNVDADQGSVFYEATLGSGASATQFIVGASAFGYHSGTDFTSTLTAGSELWTSLGVSHLCEQKTRGIIKAGSIVHPARQLTS